MQKHTPVAARILQWFFLTEPALIAKATGAYARAILEIFPLGFLLLTLTKPWKNICEVKTEHGFNLQKTLERISLNTLSRLMGCIIRIGAIACCIALEVSAAIIGAGALALWFLAPLVAAWHAGKLLTILL